MSDQQEVFPPEELEVEEHKLELQRTTLVQCWDSMLGGSCEVPCATEQMGFKEHLGGKEGESFAFIKTESVLGVTNSAASSRVLHFL